MDNSFMAKIFAAWWMQAWQVAEGMRERGHAEIAYDLHMVSQKLSDFWRAEYGADFEDEVMRLLNAVYEDIPSDTGGASLMICMRHKAEWRFEVELISENLLSTGNKQAAKKICKLIDHLDTLWKREHGQAYMELVHQHFDAHELAVKKAMGMLMVPPSKEDDQ